MVLSKSWLVISATVALCAVKMGYMVYGAVTNLQLDKRLEPSTMIDNSKCKLLLGDDRQLRGGEDFQLGKHGKLFVGAGDLRATFDEGAARAVRGGIYVFDIESSPPSEPVKLTLIGLPEEKGAGFGFQVHGIFVSNSTDRLYAVTHRGSFSSIDVFAITYDGHLSTAGVSLTHVRSVRSHLFPNAGINDVVEGKTKGELYVSQWNYFAKTATGDKHPGTLLERVKAALGIPIVLFGLPMTHVLRCVFLEDMPSVAASCESATGQIFSGANGLATTADRDTVFVSEPIFRQVHAMSPSAIGRLEPSYTIDLPHSADNIEYNDLTGELVMGTIPLIGEALASLKNESLGASGGMVVVRPPSRSAVGGAWSTVEELNHDGSMLSMVSMALRYGKRVIFGSPFSDGILVCDL